MEGLSAKGPLQSGLREADAGYRARAIQIRLEVRDLRKSYGDVQAVRGVSFEVRRGELRQ